MFFGILLHGGPVISSSEGLSGERSSSQMLGIDALVYFPQDIIDFVLFDTF
jgi:hypothetical protein